MAGSSGGPDTAGGGPQAGRRVPIDFEDLLTRGGDELLRFLHYCVYSVELAPVFVMLAGEYRLRPTVAGAIALFENFCAADAPARIAAEAVLFPRDMRLDQSIAHLRRQEKRFEDAAREVASQPASDSPGTRRPMPPPPAPLIYLFDHVVAHLLADAAGPVRAAARVFDPHREPLKNLPGGKLNAGQRAFLENVWRPRIRPRLVAAGFWRAATLGQ